MQLAQQMEEQRLLLGSREYTVSHPSQYLQKGGSPLSKLSFKNAEQYFALFKPLNWWLFVLGSARKLMCNLLLRTYKKPIFIRSFNYLSSYSTAHIQQRWSGSIKSIITPLTLLPMGNLFSLDFVYPPGIVLCSYNTYTHIH